jgi:hypothetical protein
MGFECRHLLSVADEKTAFEVHVELERLYSPRSVPFYNSGRPKVAFEIFLMFSTPQLKLINRTEMSE